MSEPDSTLKTMYFNNCGIVIRPAVQYGLAYSVTDGPVMSGKGYVEELTILLTVPKIRSYRLSLHLASQSGRELIPSHDAPFRNLSDGEHVLQFRLNEDKKTIRWRLDHKGEWVVLTYVIGKYEPDSAFVPPEEFESVDSAGNMRVRLRPFKQIRVNLYGVNGSFFLHDAD